MHTRRHVYPLAIFSTTLALAACAGASSGDTDEGTASDPLSMATLPGRIEAEAFRAGGEGVGYHDTTASNIGGSFRTSEAVDIERTTDTGGLYDVGWTAAGEWLAYDVSTSTNAIYAFSLRLASGYAGNKGVHVEVDGTALPGVTFASADGWQTWHSVAAGSTTLAAGPHVVKIVSETGHFNIDSFDANAPTGYALHFGVSGTSPDTTDKPIGTTTYAGEVNRQVSTLGATAFFDYFQDGEAPHWSGEGTSYPSSADVIASTKVADVSKVAAYVASIPARSGKVYLHYWQEPEDDIFKKGTFTLQEFLDRTRIVHTAIPAGNTTVIPTVHLQEYWLRTKGEAFEAQLIPPTTRHVSWSLYGAGTDPVQSVQRIASFMSTYFPQLSWGIGACGYGLPTGYTSADSQARAAWMTANVNAVKLTSSRHYMWFDINWPSAGVDYRIANDPRLLTSWHDVTGQ